MQIACWPVERGGRKGEWIIVWVDDEECEGRMENCVRYMLLHPQGLSFRTQLSHKSRNTCAFIECGENNSVYGIVGAF
jgi:hypothetical protein